jgi:peptide/nickel transport system ATP-binding protein/oligopeptide transport system ATP-binding protein
MSLLEVENLHTHFVSHDLANRNLVARALNGVSFSVDEGEIVGLVGETGAGKSLTAMSIMGLLQPPAKIVEGSIRFGGTELVGLKTEAYNRLRGLDMSMIVQSPVTSLDPLSRVGKHLVRVQREHRDISHEAAWDAAEKMLATVGIPAPERRMRAWPHELSGGMAQRVLIATALLNEPRLIIADEPTTGLDVTVQAQILDLFRVLMRGRNMGAIVITHDLGIVAHYCTRMCVMFAGTIVEQGPVRSVFNSPAHPYTKALILSTPKQIAQHGFGQIGGAPPDLYALPKGCPYRDRCPKAGPECATPPPENWVGEAHMAACHFAESPMQAADNG